MERLSPELVHMVVSHLDNNDRLRFRLVKKSFAIIAASHICEEVVLTIHDKDLAAVRGVAAADHLARNVKTLTYTTSFLSPTPRHNFKSYEMQNESWQRLRAFARDDKHFQSKPVFSPEELKQSYQQYLADSKTQAVNWAHREDYKCLVDALPSFSNLGKVIMSSGHQFSRHLRGRKSAYDDVAHLPDHDPDPHGVRQLEVLLDGLGLHDMKIFDLRAGLLDWRFFDNDAERLFQLYEPLQYLTKIDLYLTIEDFDSEYVYEETLKCRDFLKKGVIKDFLKSLPHLKDLSFQIQGDINDLHPAASLDWIIEPGHKWPKLSAILLEGLDCSRAGIWRILELHKDKLLNFALGDVILDGSWRKLLSDIRHKLDIYDVLIYKQIVGHAEDPPRTVEGWDLGEHEFSFSKMRHSISSYCELNGRSYPDEIPLDMVTVRKYFDSHVREPDMPLDSDSDDDDNDDDENAWGFGDYDEEEEEDEGVEEEEEEEEEEDNEDEEDDDDPQLLAYMNAIDQADGMLDLEQMVAGQIVGGQNIAAQDYGLDDEDDDPNWALLDESFRD
ncbi:hypothetical protein BJ166DRAFT_508423 [Pestalotiopsis sp. NC0098]|nr:hypothetical protein BJ166DRAFT_508423 [Pestalotiopsis sp. NC0098]